MQSVGLLLRHPNFDPQACRASLWKECEALEPWSREVQGPCKQGLVGHADPSLEGRKTNSKVETGELIGFLRGTETLLGMEPGAIQVIFWQRICALPVS